ncbi:MAG: HNH endonuclease signature motif containing protein, partial [Marinoscillum sp.]
PYFFHHFEERGILFHLGLFIFEEFVNCDNRFEIQDCEDLAWYLDTLVGFLIAGEVSPNDKWIRRTKTVTEFFDSIYDASNEEDYYRRLDRARHTLHRLYDEITITHSDKIKELASAYAANYSDRVLHDRQLCAFIAQLLIVIGFNGNDDLEGNPQQWVRRKNIPAWAKKAIYSRDRGKCAICNTDILFELSENDHIDHIIPLARGGCNDIVNLQLLCQKCNLKKSDTLQEVTSSIPPYIARRL